MDTKDDIGKVGLGLGLAEIDTEKASQFIARDILLTLRGKNPEMDKKLERVYRQWYPHGIWEEDNDKIISTLLLGPPGQGKTTAFKVAAKKVADELGLNFVLNPSADYDVTENDFLFVSQEFSAENSKMELGGIPAKKTLKRKNAKGEEVEDEFMVKLVNDRLAKMNNAGAALLLLDDFPNASPNIQNIGLSLTDEKRFQGLNLDHHYVGLTGNLGSVDGTNTGRLSTALRGRCQIFYTRDRLPNFVARARTRFNDEIGDVGMLVFLDRFPQYFATMPDVKQSGGFVSSRSWDNAILQMRRAVRDAGGRGRALNAMDDIRLIANSMLGLEVGQAIYSFLHAMMKSADPMAREVIREGKMNKEEMKKRYSEGFSADQQHFAHQYAGALVDYAVNMIRENPSKNLELAISRFAMGLMPITGDGFAYAINGLQEKLAAQVPQLSQKSNNRYDLTPKARQEIAQLVAKAEGFSQEHRQILIDTLSGASKFESLSRRRTRKTP